ncbi:MAG: helix-turn-helix domain-containing protein [Symploca sp. SIO3C6]|uniref:Helix-turn-helix domain-containing protein n=1 Tax=Symploca sp. SIO1C4 TaxID=2607765 RepID=A0A6B3NGN5_9CYAN|nr:helix-turn-helix domain-containing protein [Symploca sp. SIO3C6]NER28458.1 helix-turn-helix domain-containing protein [Symploca sp. SIO1C4]NET06308.1 helix-turn-helix domain-containing protein [Symploca sp. SIO2B6]
MLLGLKTELRIRSPKLKVALAKHAGTARHAWNWGLALTKKLLAHNQANPDDKLKFPTAIDLHLLLVKMVKPQRQWYYEVSKCGNPDEAQESRCIHINLAKQYHPLGTHAVYWCC